MSSMNWSLPDLPSGYSWGHVVNYSDSSRKQIPSSITLKLRKRTGLVRKTIATQIIELRLDEDGTAWWKFPVVDQAHAILGIKAASNILMERFANHHI